MLKFNHRMWLCLLPVVAAMTLHAGETSPQRVFLIGNSLTWDTVPPRLSGDVQWHVDCGVNLPYIFSNPDKPCVKESTLWPQALRDRRYDIVMVQPHYGSTLSNDVETISAWMKLQPQAVFVIHSGWAWHAKRGDEFAGYAVPEQMTHSPGYFRALLAELRRLHPQRELRQTFMQNLLEVIAEDIATGKSPLKQVAELYRDDIHLTNSHGKYLAHNAVRHAVGQPRSAAGFEGLEPELKTYLDGVLDQLISTADDKQLMTQLLAQDTSANRSTSIAKLSSEALRQRFTALLPRLDEAAKTRSAALALEAEIKELGGKLVWAPQGPQWLYLATGDVGTEVFDVPAAIDMYNGNNPLKGRGGRNERVTDDWLRRLAPFKTLRRLDLANCAIQGDGLRHIAGLTGLRELNLTLTPVNDAALVHLADLTELRTLGLASTQCTGTGFANLKALRQLDNVNFHFTPLNDAGLLAIAQVPISGRLWFAHTHFTNEGVAPLARQAKLKRCGLGSTEKESSGQAVAALTGLPLEDLALLDNQADAIGLAHAAKIGTLRRLDLSHAPTVKDDSLPLIAKMPALEEFKLGSAQVTDDGLQSLADSKTLKKLYLSGLKGVTAEGVARLRQARPELHVELN